jgi:hypothetical protein
MLSQNYPNPFNSATNFEFQIAEKGFVSLKIYDLLGNEVATILDKELTAGTFKFQWEARDISSGNYFYKLRAGNFIETRKLILLK